MSGPATASPHRHYGATGFDAPTSLSDSLATGPPPAAATYRGIYDALGPRKNCSSADCRVADELAKHLPGGRAGAKALATIQKAFTYRAGRMMIAAKVEQFLVCGVDLSLTEPLHGFLRHCTGPSRDTPRVVYLDDNPESVALARASLGAADTFTHVALVDHRDPRAAMMASVDGDENPAQRRSTVRAHLDFNRPIGLIHCGLLPHLADNKDPSATTGLMRSWNAILPEGSFLALTHFCLPEQNRQLATIAAQAEDIFAASPLGAGIFLKPTQFTALFCGHELVQPSPGHAREVVPVEYFWPDGPTQDGISKAITPLLWGGIARKGKPFGLIS
ncbi:SAM-dependent methyltransferase [Amycolatopsis sp. cmx-11-32]|uniref:SAM-dependent methyltransferase n=1 Tax=Amycolatopsis sp. cmx-11-32 TaxID=2785796 RepID=UPI0039E66FF9